MAQTERNTTRIPVTPRAAAGIQLAQRGLGYDAPAAAPSSTPVQTLQPQSSNCTVSLILLMDESGSISHTNWEKQLHATADALIHPEVLDAVRQVGGISIMARAFNSNSRTLTPWYLVNTPQDMQNFANALRLPHGQRGGGTEIGGSVIESIPLFPLSPCKYPREVVDVSTDGESPTPTMQSAREIATERGIVINGIAVNTSDESAQQTFDILRDNLVTRTNGGRTWLANWEEYGAVIRQKLIQEIAGTSKAIKQADADVEIRTPLPALKPLLASAALER